MSFLSNAAKRIPQFAVVERRIATQEMTLQQVRRELWNRRIEFWIRKAQSVPTTISGAKAEIPKVCEALKNPSHITYKQLATAGVWGVQIFGAFCVGEVIGRGSLFGYPAGNHPGAVHAAHH